MTTAAIETPAQTNLLDDIDAIIALANQASSTPVDQSISQPAEQPTNAVIDQVAVDVDAILAEINGASAIIAAPPPPPLPVEKPARAQRAPKSTDASAQGNTPGPVVDAAAGAVPSPAPAATDPVAFLALLTDADRAAYDGRLAGAAIKVREKAENAVAALTTGKKLSRFTSLAVKHLVTAGEVTSTDLVKVYTDAGLAMGTARAQSQQMTALFRMFGLVSQNGRAFTISNQALVEQLALRAA